MEKTNIKQLLEQHPYLKRVSEYTIFTTKEEIEKLKDSEKVTVNKMEISIEFLKKILNDDIYYQYAYKFFKGETKDFRVSSIINGDTGSSISYTKSQIIKGIINLILTNQLKLSEEQNKKYESLRKNISLEKLLEDNKGKNYEIEIDGDKYLIPIEKIMSIMTKSEEEFFELINNAEIKYITGIKKEYFIYACYRYFKDNRIIQEYLVPEVVTDRYKRIRSFETIDIESINKLLKTTDTKYEEVKVDKRLENLIISEMPDELTKLEKAIYIYIKMCKLLTYDDEYYAVHQRGIVAKKHHDINYISTINPENNKVVCFEFNLIYAILLGKLGIKFESSYRNMIGEAYGDGHANLIFRSGKFLIKADSVTSILQGDIMQAKLNQPLKGLTCINKNENTWQEFKNTVSKIYQLIAKQEKKSINELSVEHIETFNELVNEYLYISSEEQKISINEKIAVLTSKLNSKNIKGIDYLSYIIQLRKILFTEEERKNNVCLSIIRDNESYEYQSIAMTSAILTINKKGFAENPDYNSYYYFNSNTGILPISKSRLQEKFDEKIYEYIYDDDYKVPGIEENKIIKR